MSCHDIGRGMNSVVRTTITLMDEGKVSKSAARVIVNSCAKGVNWCDGNQDEATEYIRRCLCGRCMKKVPKGEKLYSVWDVSMDVPNRYDVDKDLASDGLCEECFDLVLNSHCQDDEAGPRERAQIESHSKEEDYTSTGEYNESWW